MNNTVLKLVSNAGDQDSKQCTKCKEWKPNTEKYFVIIKKTWGNKEGHHITARCRRCAVEYTTKWRNSCEDHKERCRKSNLRNYRERGGRLKQKDFVLRKKYGITLSEYNEMVAAQNGICLICEESPEGKGRHGILIVDHCHDTEKVRGLLCARCNIALGGFQDSKELLEKALEYLDYE